MSQESEIRQAPGETHLNPPVIAIIGGGMSGILVAVQLLKRAKKPLKIQLIESQLDLARGVAYQTDILNHLLNVPTGKMSAFPDEPDHFFQWLEQQGDLLASWGDHSLTPSSFVPRKFYRIYGQSLLEQAIKNAPSHVIFEWIKDRAIGIQYHKDQGVITLQKGQPIYTDKIVLALGNFPPSNPPIPDPSFYQNHQDYYISYPWSSNVFSGIKPEDHILFIGSGLTMIDLAVTLHSKNHRGKIYVISRHGLLPHSHQLTESYLPLNLLNLEPLTILNLLRQVRQEIRKSTDQGSNWRSIIDGIRPETQALWSHLPLLEKQRFLRHLRPYWEIHRHRMAPQIGGIIQELLNRQQLQVYAGRITHYNLNPNHPQKIDVFCKKRHQDELMLLTVSRVINCTGSECNYRQFQDPLIINLREQGLIQPDELNLGLKVTDKGALISDQGIPSSSLYTLGAPRKGTLWETTAIPEIRQQAVILSQELLNSFQT